MAIQQLAHPMRRPQRSIAGFSLIEVLMAASVLIIALGSVAALNSQVINNLRRGVVGSFASQLIQERMEQFRRAAWTEITCNYPPASEDPADVNYDSEGETSEYIEDSYPTAFPYDLAELSNLEPGILGLMSQATGSAAQLSGVVEQVRVEGYNASNAEIEIWDADGSKVKVAPFSVGGTAIVVKRENGAVTTVTHNAVMVLNTTVRLTFRVSWTGTDKVTRTKETVTLFTVEGDK